MTYPKYEIWIADLNSLYDNDPRPPVFFEDCYTIEDARAAVNEIQTHDMAVWIQNKNTGKIVK